jgi:hypothetical protein
MHLLFPCLRLELKHLVQSLAKSLEIKLSLIQGWQIRENLKQLKEVRLFEKSTRCLIKRSLAQSQTGLTLDFFWTFIW